MANDIVKRVVGGTFIVLHGELLSLRILVSLYLLIVRFIFTGRGG